MRYILFCFGLLFSLTPLVSQAQGGRFDLSLVEQLVKEGQEYDQLLKRMREGDETLTTIDYRYIYYGFQFREEYYGSMDTIHYHVGQLIEKKKISEAFETSKKALEKNPVSLRLLLYCIQTGRELGMSSEQLSLYTQPFLEITYVIALSGNGQTEKTAFKVLSITDEYILMQFYFGITDILSQDVVEENGRIYDYFHIKPTPEYTSPAIYFDITPSILKMSELYGND